MTDQRLPYRDLDSTACSIARTAQIVGDPWNVLVLRDISNGLRRFDDLVDHLGIARPVLTRRLSALRDAGLVERSTYRDPGQRSRPEYRLTAAGRDLQIVLLAMVTFGDRHLAGPEGPPAVVEHVGCGAAVHARLVCADGHVLDPDPQLRLAPGPGARRR